MKLLLLTVIIVFDVMAATWAYTAYQDVGVRNRPEIQTPRVEPVEAPEKEIKPYSYTNAINEVNTYRKKKGKSELIIDKSLMESAHNKARYMEVHGYGHFTNGTELTDFIEGYYGAGENIAMNVPLDEVVEAWWNSPSHRKIILGNWCCIGIGVSGPMTVLHVGLR